MSAWEVASGFYVPPWIAIAESGPTAGHGSLLRGLLDEGWEPFAVTSSEQGQMVWVRRQVES